MLVALVEMEHTCHRCHMFCDRCHTERDHATRHRGVEGERAKRGSGRRRRREEDNMEVLAVGRQR
jgi:hypothetical protein